jgi:hypothetical protein
MHILRPQALQQIGVQARAGSSPSLSRIKVDAGLYSRIKSRVLSVGARIGTAQNPTTVFCDYQLVATRAVAGEP